MRDSRSVSNDVEGGRTEVARRAMSQRGGDEQGRSCDGANGE